MATQQAADSFIRALALRNGSVETLHSVAEIETAFADESAVLWVDLGNIIEKASADLLCATFGLHPLVVEDLILDYLLPKLEEFPDYAYVLMHALHVPGRIEDFKLSEIDLLLGRRWVITHHHGLASIEQVFAECSKGRKLLERGPAWVAHAVLDRVVDAYAPALQVFEDEVERVEDLVLAGNGTELLERISWLKRALMKVRRTAAHQREVLGRLCRNESPLLPEPALPFYRDVLDHMGNVLVLAENAREQAGMVFEMHLSLQSHRMNEVMKILTKVSTMFMPLSLIAGIYGMNFEHMPELKWHYGYPIVWLMMAVIAACMIVFFRRKDW